MQGIYASSDDANSQPRNRKLLNVVYIDEDSYIRDG